MQSVFTGKMLKIIKLSTDRLISRPKHDKQCGNLRYSMTYKVIWANQKTKDFSITGYALLQCLMYRTFRPFCRASDVVLSSVDTLIDSSTTVNHDHL